jgi:predicted tellurium resistance membrane protein TerC
MDSSILFSFDSFVALVTLTTLEIVLGIDNIVFLAVLTERLP